MLAVKRPYVLAAAALAATSLVAATPTASQYNIEAAQLAVRHVETNLVDAEESLLNVPLNLLYDVINIPANELYASQFFTDNLFMAGPWFVVSPTNLWGVDPGDPTHYMSVLNFLMPFTALSGMDSPETDFSAGLGQQLWGLVASELPTNASCDEFACAPFEVGSPDFSGAGASPITGNSGVDFFVWLDSVLGGQTKFGLFDNWFNADYNADGSYFFDPSNPGSVEPVNSVTDGQVFGFDGWSSTSGLLGGDGIPGTTGVDGVGDGIYMPWAGDTYQFEPWVPFQNFFNSLMEAPSTTGLDGTGIDAIYGDPTEIFQTFQSFAAGLMMFDPVTPGSPFCPGDCSAIVNAHLDYPDLIKDINNWTPGGNPVINEWLADYTGTTVNGVAPDPDGGANVPTADGIERSIFLLQNHDFWDFGNTPYTGENTAGNPDLGAVYPQFEAFWQSLGFDTSNAPYDPTTSLAALENAFGPDQLSADFAALANSFSPDQLAADWAALLGGFDPGALAGAVDPASAVGAFDPAALLAAVGL
jgi:hypothetical protein